MSGFTQPIHFSFLLDKPPGYKLVCEPETKYIPKKNNNFFLNKITFYSQDDNFGEVILIGETLTFTLQLIEC